MANKIVETSYFSKGFIFVYEINPIKNLKAKGNNEKVPHSYNKFDMLLSDFVPL